MPASTRSYGTERPLIRHQYGVRYVCLLGSRTSHETNVLTAIRINIAVGIAIPACSLAIQRALYGAIVTSVPTPDTQHVSPIRSALKCISHRIQSSVFARA
jgi:hypothetical protein